LTLVGTEETQYCALISSAMLRDRQSRIGISPSGSTS
jgi:hypothetical protein